MSRPRRPVEPLRRVRGAVVGLVGGAVAVGGHVVGGGSAVTPAVLAALALVVAGTVVASSARWTAPRLLVALLAAQPAVHGVLWLSSPADGLDPRLLGARATTSGGHAAHEHAGLDARMLLGHAAAVVVAAVVLAALERCVLALWALVHAVRLATARVTVPSPRRAPALPSYAVPAPGLAVVARRPRRGPPALPAPC